MMGMGNSGDRDLRLSLWVAVFLQDLEICMFVVRANFVGKKEKKNKLTKNQYYKKYSTYLAPFSTKNRI